MITINIIIIIIIIIVIIVIIIIIIIIVDLVVFVVCYLAYSRDQRWPWNMHSVLVIIVSIQLPLNALELRYAHNIHSDAGGMIQP